MGTLEHLAQQYLTARSGELLAITRSSARSTLLIFATSYGNRPLDKLGQAAIRRWLAQRSGLKPSTMATQWSQVSTFLDWLVRKGKIRVNPMLDMKAPRRPRTEPRTIEPGDITAILTAAPDARARAIVMLEWGMGARRVEVHRVNVEDWSRRGGVMRLMGKGGHEREITVPRYAAHAFNAYLSEYPASVGPFFRSYTRPHVRLSVSAIGHYVAQWMIDAGVKQSPHDGLAGHSLRRTCASELLDETGDIRTVQEVLGHAHLSSSAPYLRRMNRLKMRDAMETRRVA